MTQEPETGNGWIRLYRKLQDNPLWTERREFSKAEAWIDLLLSAQHSPKPTDVLLGTHMIVCSRGQCIKSLDTWARRWNWSKSKVRRYLDLLTRLNMVRCESVTKTTRITICNYDSYNKRRHDDEPIVNRSRHDDEPIAAPDKNVENAEEGKNETSLEQPPVIERAKSFKQWTDDEFKEEIRNANHDKLLTDDQCYDFFYYWTEPSASGKAKYKLERTWDTRRRMQRAKTVIYDKRDNGKQQGNLLANYK